MSDEPTQEEVEKITQGILDELMKAMPLRQFVESQCSDRFPHWTRRLAAHPAALAEFKPLRPNQLDLIMACIERHPVLKAIADREWRLFHTHNLRAVLFGQDLPAPKAKSKEWKKIFEKLTAILAPTGRNDALGKGDYFLVDDEVEEPGHKIELRTPEILTPRLVEEIQAALRGWKNVWYVIIQLDVDRLNLDTEPGGIVIWADHVDDIWDRNRMRELLGPRFRL